MPKKMDRCVKKVKMTVKPKKGKTKTSSAWAICKSSKKK